jgi:hypothetical protein
VSTRSRRPAGGGLVGVSLAWAYTAARGWHLLAAPPGRLCDEWDAEVDADIPPTDTAAVPADLIARDGLDAVLDQLTAELRRRDGYDHSPAAAPAPPRQLRVVA